MNRFPTRLLVVKPQALGIKRLYYACCVASIYRRRCSCHAHPSRAKFAHPLPPPPPPSRPCLRVQPIEGTDVYVALVFSCQELPDLKELHKIKPDAKIVFFNLRLDTLRGDLGLPAFPPKASGLGCGVRVGLFVPRAWG